MEPEPGAALASFSMAASGPAVKAVEAVEVLHVETAEDLRVEVTAVLVSVAGSGSIALSLAQPLLFLLSLAFPDAAAARFSLAAAISGSIAKWLKGLVLEVR